MSLYLHAITLAGRQDELGRGLHGAPLFLVPAGDVAAVVTALEGPLSPSKQALMAHNAVALRLGEGGPALPARFGQISTRQELEHALEERGSELAAALRLVAGCVQMTLRVAGDAAAPAPSRQEAPAAGLGPGAAYLARRRDALLPAPVRALHVALEDLTRGERLRPSKRPPLLASLHHLVARGELAAWRRAVAEVPLEHIRVSVSGPWPPYAFAPESI